jgi:hypothetical protein
MNDARPLRLSPGVAVRVLLMAIVIVFGVTVGMAYVVLLTSEGERVWPLTFEMFASALGVSVAVALLPGAVAGPIAGAVALFTIQVRHAPLTRAGWVGYGTLGGLCAGVMVMALNFSIQGRDGAMFLAPLGAAAGMLSGALLGLYVGRLARVTNSVAL